jgi:hypothetical protein
MDDKTKKCVELKFECQKLSEKVYGSETFNEEDIDNIRKKIHLNLENVLSLLRRK